MLKKEQIDDLKAAGVSKVTFDTQGNIISLEFFQPLEEDPIMRAFKTLDDDYASLSKEDRAARLKYGASQ